MKKFIIFSIFLLSLLYSYNTNAGSGCCSWHGGQSYCDTTTGRRVCNDGTYSPSCTCGGGSYYYTPTYNTYSCSSYGIYAKNNYDGTCSCMTGYHFETNSLGDKTCVKDKTCSDLYGYNSIDNYDGTCSCKSGYIFSTNTFGNKTCISEDKSCQDEFGYGAESIGNGYCGCKSGYIMGLNSLGKKECNSGYTYCSSTYGVNSKFNLLSNSCECYSGYEWNSNNTSCVKKLNQCSDTINGFLGTDGKCYCNSGYYWSDDSNKCIKQKTYTEMCQESYGFNSYGDENYCYCNTGYEWNSGKTSCVKIKEKSAITLCQESYGLNSTSNGVKNNDGTYNCGCKSGYEWNSDKTNCIIKINSSYSGITDKNKQTAEILFNNIKSKISNFSQDRKEKIYESLLEKIEILKINAKGDTIIILDYLKDFINNENSVNIDDLFGDLFDK